MSGLLYSDFCRHCKAALTFHSLADTQQYVDHRMRDRVVHHAGKICDTWPDAKVVAVYDDPNARPKDKEEEEQRRIWREVTKCEDRQVWCRRAGLISSTWKSLEVVFPPAPTEDPSSDRTLLNICEADLDDKTDTDYQAALIKSEIIQQAIRKCSDTLNSFTLERVHNAITAATGIASDTISKKEINLNLPFARAGSRDDDEEHDDEMAVPAKANSPVAGKVNKSVKDNHCPTYCYSAKDIKSSAAGNITLGAVRDARRFQSRGEAKHAGSSDDEQADDSSTLRSTHKSFKHRPRLTTVQVPANTAICHLAIKVDPEPSALERDGDIEMAGEPGGAANNEHCGDGPDWFDQHGAVNYVDRGLKTTLNATLVQWQFEFDTFFVPTIKRALDAARQILPFHPSTLKVYSNNCNSLRDLFFAFTHVTIVVQEHDTGQAPPSVCSHKSRVKPEDHRARVKQAGSLDSTPIVKLTWR
ncbi:hypothetical protein JCM5296_005786 [Sporobolomyces johnsonii]